jgi:hypothetical protein
LRAAAIDQFFQLGTGDNTLKGRTPGFVMCGRNRRRIRSFGRPNLDQRCAHELIKASRSAVFKVYP